MSLREDIWGLFAEAQQLAHRPWERGSLSFQLDRAEYQRAWWAENRELMNWRKRVRYAANLDAERERKRARRCGPNAERVREQGRRASARYHAAHRDDPAFRAANAERARAWYAAHRERVNGARRAKRRTA